MYSRYSVKAAEYKTYNVYCFVSCLQIYASIVSLDTLVQYMPMFGRIAHAEYLSVVVRTSSKRIYRAIHSFSHQLHLVLRIDNLIAGFEHNCVSTTFI